MAESNAETGFGTTVEIETGAGTGLYFEVEEMQDVDFPEDTADQHERTHMKSPNGRKEYAAGLLDGGSLEFPHNYIPGSTTDLAIKAWKAIRDTRRCRITHPPAAGVAAEIFLVSYETYRRKAPVNGVRSAALVVKCAGDV